MQILSLEAEELWRRRQPRRRRRPTETLKNAAGEGLTAKQAGHPLGPPAATAGRRGDPGITRGARFARPTGDGFLIVPERLRKAIR
jgi:hypothetical protein